MKARMKLPFWTDAVPDWPVAFLGQASWVGAYAVALLCALGEVMGQGTGNPGGERLGRVWEARWIAHPQVPGKAFSVQHFRRVIELPEVPRTWVVHVSADPRCRLFVNGVEIWTGPARSDLAHWPYATLDLAPHLWRGANVLGATVWNHGEHNPWSQMSHRTGFLLQGAGPAEAVANTGAGWRVYADPSHVIADLTRYPGFITGRTMRFDARTHPWGWTEAQFDDRSWEPAGTLEPAAERGARDASSPWWLEPQTIPAQQQTLQRFAAVRRSAGPAPGPAFLNGEQPWTIPANSTVSLLLDQEHLTNAYPEIVASGGRDAEVRIRWTEALFDAQGRKGHRGEIEGRTFNTPPDVFVLDGGERRLLRTQFFRTFRFLQVDITTAADPLTILDLRSVFTGYPFEENASFRSSDPSLEEIWRVGWRTLRLCAGDTFYDCPFYEQLQYVGDTRIQALIALYVSGDDRLVKSAIAAFDQSRLPEGLTASRHPSARRQVIPPYSLFWIAMIHDYWMHGRDEAFVRQMLDGVDGVLTWFERRLGPDGMPGPIEWWNFGDWAPNWPRGVPPGAVEGGSAFIALQHVLAARQAAELYDAFGDAQRAERWRRSADRVARAVEALCWDAGRGLYADTPQKLSFSQHVNSLAVVSKTATGRRAREIVTRTLDDRRLTQCTFYFRFYVMRAMAAVGLGDRFLGELQPWRDMLEIGLTTFAEKPEPTRSDCHAWSASPNYDFLALVAGITPDAPGFRRVRIAPALGALESVNAKMPHPDGEIAVRLQRKAGGGIVADVSLPAGVTGAFVWGDTERPLVPGVQTVEVPVGAEGGRR